MSRSEGEARLRSLLRDAPRSALKAARNAAGLSQSELAREAGIAQTQYADIEGGRRNLTPAMAKRLAAAMKSLEPTLAVGAAGDLTGPTLTGENLEAAHLIGGVKRLAADDPDALSAEVLVELIRWLDARLPETEGAGDLLDALLSLLDERVKAYREQRALEKPAKVATKSAQRAPDRDAFGRRRNKPNRPVL